MVVVARFRESMGWGEDERVSVADVAHVFRLQRPIETLGAIEDLTVLKLSDRISRGLQILDTRRAFLQLRTSRDQISIVRSCKFLHHLPSLSALLGIFILSDPIG